MFNKWSIVVIIGFICAYVNDWLESSFYKDFLKANLILLLVALLAINATTISIIVGKLKDIINDPLADFTNTTKSLRSSITEQVILIVIASVFQVASDSMKIRRLVPLSDLLIQSVLIAIFIYAIYIMYDTAHAAFMLLDINRKTKD